MKNSTIQYYNMHADAFAAGTENADMQECRAHFLQYLQPGQKILDAGCGSGRDTLAFLSAGYAVDAMDASESLCRIASKRTGIPIRCQRFEELDDENIYDGIWACASLLHVPKEALPDVLLRLHRLLLPRGILYASFRYGAGDRIKDGRYFHDMDECECRKLLEPAGFRVIEIFITTDVRKDRTSERWTNVIARK